VVALCNITDREFHFASFRDVTIKLDRGGWEDGSGPSCGVWPMIRSPGPSARSWLT
jgi:hypothetical protein